MKARPSDLFRERQKVIVLAGVLRRLRKDLFFASPRLLAEIDEALSLAETKGNSDGR